MTGLPLDRAPSCHFDRAPFCHSDHAPSCHFDRALICHFDRAKRAEKSLYENIPQHKQHRQDPHRNRNVLEAAGNRVHHDIGDDADQDTVGDRVRERHEGDRQERRDAAAVVLPVDAGHGRHHHDADDDQGRGGRGARDREEDRREEQREAEADGDREGGEAGAAAVADAGGAFDVSRGRRGAEAGAGDGRDGVGEEDLVDVLNLVALDEAGRLADADHGAHRVEHVDEQEGQDDDEHVPGEDVVPLELHEDGGDAVREGDELRVAGGVAGQLGHGFAGRGVLDEEADDGRGEDADEDAAADFEHHEAAGDDEAEDGDEGRAVGHVTEDDEGRVAVHDDAGVLHADEGDEEADTGADGFFQGAGDRVDQVGPDLRDGHEDEQDAFDEDGGQGELPVVAHREADREDEEGVQAHAGGEAEGLLRVEGHDEGTDDGGQGGRREDGALRHPVEGAEDAGVDGQDVGHRQEGRDARDDLRPDIVLLGIKSESLVQEWTHRL